MDISPPSGEELERLISENAHRFPVKYSISVIGDGGASIKLPFLLGLPSGACVLPPGGRKSDAWNSIVGSGIGIEDQRPGIDDRVAEDCIIWPPRAEWSKWFARWTGLGGSVGKAIQKAAGFNVSVVVSSGEPPESIRSELAKRPRAAWRTIVLGEERIEVVIEPPEYTPWRIFKAALAKQGADVWALVLDMVLAKATADGADIAKTVARWPAVAIHLLGEISRLGGGGAEAELGGW